MPRIAQAEFFLVDVGADSFKGLLSDTAERLKDRAPLKLCFRFYDEDGLILRFAQRAEYLDAMSQKILARLVTARGLQRWWLNKRSRWIAGARLRLKARATDAAIKRAEQVIHGRLPVAVETEDHRFAPLEDAERHELAESVRRAKSSWLFIFEPSELCFERNSLVASLM